MTRVTFGSFRFSHNGIRAVERRAGMVGSTPERH